MDSTPSPSDATTPTPAPQSTLPPSEQLPPVQPPSAGFIMQLFLVPGVIVAAVVGVWALFGQISSSEQDWRQLVAELRSTNEHRRWRGANALAQVLRADADLGDKGQKLAGNEQIAKELTSLVEELLQQTTTDKELVTHQSFAVTALGWLDTEAVIFPTLIKAMQPGKEPKVRSDAIRAVAQVAGRKALKNEQVKDAEIINQLIETSRDENPLLRQVVAFTLGLLPGDDVDQRLKVMCGDADSNCRTNAALALSRRGLTDGVPVLLDVLKKSTEKIDVAAMPGPSEAEKRNQATSQQEVNAIAAFNAFKALRDLSSKLDDAQREQAAAECERVHKESEFRRIQMDANLTAQELRKK